MIGACPRIKWWLVFGWTVACLAKAVRADTWQGSAEVRFEATSTLHDFAGTVRTQPFAGLVTFDDSVAILSATASVAVADMDTRHAKRDMNMRRMFAADRFPLVTGVLDQARLEPPFPRQVPLRLTICDHVQTIPATIVDARLQDGRLRFDLALELSLRECRLSPPVILGFIKVGDLVQVRIQVDMEKPAGADPP